MDAEGNLRDVTRGSLQPPLGSGPYRIGKIIPGRTIAYARVPDYWGRDLPVNIGQNNFDEIRYEYFRDNTVEFEAFKADKIDFRNENQAKRWASEYGIPAVKRKRVVLEKFPERGRGVGVGWIYNLRRDTFSDIRVRRAFNMAFNFEEANRTLFYGQYERIDSFHFGSELRSAGVPEGLELEILETVRGQVPEALFNEPYTIPIAETPQAHRANLRQAIGLLREAGYTLEGSSMRHKETGKPLKIEYLFLAGSSFERVGLRLQKDLEKIGVKVTLRPVDSAQYENRIRARDFDLVILGWGQSLSPGNEQLEYFGSKAADLDASRNFGGIKNPAVDALIDRIIFAKDRDELIAATKALDRVLLWNEYILPTWTILSDRTARWDRFGRPETLPYYSEPAFPTVWWWDEAMAKAVEERK
jgi:microcin C transport system substrate-binding protein